MAEHPDLLEPLAIHPPAYVAASDPGAVGAHKFWVDTASGPPYQLKKRNASNTAWESIGGISNLALADVKDSVRVASTGNLTISAPGATIDGVTMSAGDRVLVKDQSTSAENGLYIWNGAASAMARATDADVSAEVTPGMFVFVEEGTVNADTGWVLTTNAPITLGTTALAFAKFTGGGGSDSTAIHDDTAGEVAAVTEKTAPVAADLLLIEDSAASNVKKRVQAVNLTKAFKAQEQVYIAGTLVVATGKLRLYNQMGRTVTLVEVFLSVDTAPTGAAIIVDVNKNAVTVFTTQSNRPQITAGSNTGFSTAIEVNSWANGDHLTVDVDQIGSTIAGADLTVHIVYN